MKVGVKEKNGFQPIKLTITIESKEELESLKMMCGLNVTISELFDKKVSYYIKDLLDKVRYMLSELEFNTNK